MPIVPKRSLPIILSHYSAISCLCVHFPHCLDSLEIQDCVLLFFIWAISGTEPYTEWLFRISWFNDKIWVKTLKWTIKIPAKVRTWCWSLSFPWPHFGYLFIGQTLIIAYFMPGSYVFKTSPLVPKLWAPIAKLMVVA